MLPFCTGTTDCTATVHRTGCFADVAPDGHHGPGRPGYLYIVAASPARDREAPFDKAVTAAGVPAFRHTQSLWISTVGPAVLAKHLEEDADLWARDLAALHRADTFVLLDPALDGFGHLELGYAAGLGKRTCVLLGDRIRPWPALAVADYLAPTVSDLIDFLHLRGTGD